MKKFQRFCTLFLPMLVMCFSTLYAQSYNSLWRQVEQAEKKGLPQTVVKLAEEICRKAEREKNAPQLLKAYFCRDAYQEKLTPDSLYTHLPNLERWAKEEQDTVSRAILHSLLARKYADYMRYNWKTLSQAPALDMDEAPADIREWSYNLFAAKIDGHCLASLRDARRLLEVSSREYAPFVVQKDGSRFYGHDMYHLLARRAINTYLPLHDGRIDSLRRVRIDGIYRNMIDAYRHRAGAEDAVVLATLDYWNWKKDEGVSREPDATYMERKAQFDKEYLEALDGLIREYGAREICAEVYICKANRLHDMGETRADEVLQVCDEGVRRYPACKRANELRNIRERLLLPYLGVDVGESVYPGDSLRLSMSYRNLKGYTLNLYRTDLPEVPWMDAEIDKAFYRKHARKLSSTHFDLDYPADKDGKPANVGSIVRHKVMKISGVDSTGVYILQVVPDAAEAHTAEQFLVSTRFKVLTLSLPDDNMELVVVDGRSGHPVPDAEVCFYSTYRENERSLVQNVVTDADGKAVVKLNKFISSYAVRKGTDIAMTPQRVYWDNYYERGDSRPKERVTLLTDRSVYRPGQTVYVKGISYLQKADKAHVLARKEYRVRLLDVNRKELLRKTVTANEFGSFTTELPLPAACLKGSYTVEVEDKASVSVRVEEYKRPTFEIIFNPVKQAYSLGDTVVVTGKVKAYNGMAVQDVPLAYTVIRYPYNIYVDGDLVPFSSDTVRLDAEGNFSIPVFLKPGNVSDDIRWDRLAYHVEATVTDEAGETQTERYKLYAGRRACFFSVTGMDGPLCKENAITAELIVTNGNDETLPVKGTCRLYSVIDAKTKRMSDSPVYEGTFMSGETKDFAVWKQLPSGEYRLVLSASGDDGRKTGDDGKKTGSGKDTIDIVLFSLADPRPVVFSETFLYKKNVEFDAGHPAEFYFGTSVKDAYVLVDVFGSKGRLESGAILLSDSIVRMEYPYREEYGEGVSVQFTFVKNGERSGCRVELRKRLPRRTLDMKWEVFRDRLRPGQEEEWKLVVKTPQGHPAAAEVLAMMYDASLDRICKHNQSLGVYYYPYIPHYNWHLGYNATRHCAPHFPMKSWEVPVWRFDHLWSSYYNGVDEALYGRPRATLTGSVNGMMVKRSAAAKGGQIEYVSMADEEEPEEHSLYETIIPPPSEQILPPMAELRTDFSETAFFYPQLRTNAQGEVAFSFTMPQSLTRWNFRGYSHTKEMMTGMLHATAVTAKEFMLTPNMPRFVRVGDKTQIAAGIANLSDKAVKGTAVFTLFDPMTEKVISVQRRKFSVEAGKRATVVFPFDVTDRCDLLGVRMVADGGAFSDGEQHLLPVLGNKEYITEAIAMPVRGEEARTFSLERLFNGNSRTATDRRLTVEFTGNPAWYAVQALPALSQSVADNAISRAAAFYANSLAGHIADSRPRIKAVFDNWRSSGGTKETFLSQLEKNQDVKNILLDNSPWLLEATTEAERHQRIATLFDVNQLNYRNMESLLKLKELQGEDGAWSWFGGMSGSRYVTSYVTRLLVRLSLLTGKALPEEAEAMKGKAFGYLNKQAFEEYRLLRKAEKNGAKVAGVSGAAMDYLYLVTLASEKLSGEYAKAFDYFLGKLGHNPANGTMVGKAQTAAILQRVGRKAAADQLMASVKEHLVQTDEMGAHFAFHDGPYNWGMLPVPAHVAVMEALREAGGNDALVEEMKLWLLKQKQATSWNSPVATADAVYALLCQGDNLLESQGDVRITLGSKVLETGSPAQAAMPGLGYVRETFAQGAPELKATSVTVEKRDAGIAWGAVYAQYLSPLSDVKQQGGGLNIEKRLFVERISANGQKSLQPLTDAGPLSVGDKVIARLTLRLDRAMDFIQLKDQRGACFEPIGSLSGYRWSNGFGFYVEVEDTGANFFFDHLGKGVYVLEHSYRVARGGTYETGLATVQCAYAPEYASHTAGGTVVIR
ncbi:alpha-2-macroglobulin family protein [uncultured Bacteroides sp.]|uniref:alpha-2-macroglobulin family protein n=1 Tax=uncultured Bacteroides sp. TaxID=162156 RepID=UPI0025F214E1|nr:alpha-2-macroglobulin family protein [uncultured Bacteroides sp.]